ncbi:MAG: hypothetical protein CTY19_12300 [Methylomonas sp.]|nr:MAG: hypothetical protein CTY19_12300 [Methylomonas sp.]
MSEDTAALLNELISVTKRKDKIQGYHNLEAACDYLEREGVLINAGTVARHLDNKDIHPANATAIRNDADGYMRYVKARGQEQLAKSPQATTQKDVDDRYTMAFWMKVPHNQVCLALVTNLVTEKSLRHELDLQKKLNRQLSLDPDKLLGIVASPSEELVTNHYNPLLLDDIKEALRILSRLAHPQPDAPNINILNLESQQIEGIFQSREFFDAFAER